MVGEYVPGTYRPEWHSVTAITLGQLVESGFYDPEDPSWKWDAYSDEQYSRLCSKFVARYYLREIGITPPGQWKREYIRILNEVMPKYKALYKAIEDGANVLSASDRYGKSRNIYSDFPATMLGGSNQDYASNGTDREYEDVEVGPFMETAEALAERYNDVDVLVLRELAQLFSSLMTVNANAL